MVYKISFTHSKPDWDMLANFWMTLYNVGIQKGRIITYPGSGTNPHPDNLGWYDGKR